MGSITAYRLVQDITGEPVFQAAYVKYFPDTPYCALFLDYPAENTTVQLCRRIRPEESNLHGYNRCRLERTDSKDSLGLWLRLGKAATEKEAIQKIEQQSRADEALQQLLKGVKR